MKPSEKDREAAHAVEAMCGCFYEKSGNHAFNEGAMLAIAEAIATARAEGRREGLEERDKDGLWKWLTERVHRGEGAVVLCLTEDGLVGVWLHGEKYPLCIACGDDAKDAVERARAAIRALADAGEDA